MSKSFLYLLVCTPLFAFSQSDITRYKKFSLGINMEVNFVKSFLRHGRTLNHAHNLPDITGVGKIGGALGLNLNYTLTSNLSIGTGLLFSDRGYATRLTDLKWSSLDDTYPTQSKTVFNYYFVEFPLRLKYQFHTLKCSWYVTGGPSVGHLIFSKTSVFTYYRNTYEKAVSKKLGDGYTSHFFSFHIGIGIDVPVSDNLSLHFEPLYRQVFTSLSHHSDIKRHFRSIGLNTHLSLRYKK